VGGPYAGSCAEFVDQHGGAATSVIVLYALAQEAGKPWSYNAVACARRQSRTKVFGPDGKPVWNERTAAKPVKPADRVSPALARRALKDPATLAQLAADWHAAHPNGFQRTVSPAAKSGKPSKVKPRLVGPPPKSNGHIEKRRAVVVDEQEDDGPPPSHTALRRAILNVGLEAAQQIFAEFSDALERIR